MQAIINMLELILVDQTNRENLIRDFQKRIGNSIFETSEKEAKIYANLAYKVENYEPDEEVRNEDPSLFGDDKLVDEIKKALVKLSKVK
jgi:hypothetical protein